MSFNFSPILRTSCANVLLMAVRVNMLGSGSCYIYKTVPS